jgi:hypothetical protein
MPGEHPIGHEENVPSGPYGSIEECLTGYRVKELFNIADCS